MQTQDGAPWPGASALRSTGTPDAATARAGSRVVVLDDDPTGTQCAADVDVALNPRPEALAEFHQRALYVLTNTRAVDTEAAAQIVHGVYSAFVSRPDAAAIFVLRGDSTLRGHVAAEMRALGLDDAVGLVVPAYPEAGRVTVGGVHYLDSGRGRVNVADTEFANDPVFGYRSRTVPDWLREVGVAAEAISIELARLRDGGPSVVAQALLHAHPGTVVVPDAETDTDIAIIAAGFWEARAAGRAVVTRCAAPLAAAIAGKPGRLLGPASATADRVLVVCGSHTAAATRQLQQLIVGRLPVRALPTEGLLGERVEDVVAPVVARLSEDLAERGLAIVATERRRRREHDTLHHAARVMDGLIRVVAALAGQVDAVVSKGGITSADTATRGLGGRVAHVRGQVMTGVPLWEVRTRDERLVPQVVVPGNVGDDGTLIRICGFLGKIVGKPDPMTGSLQIQGGGDVQGNST